MDQMEGGTWWEGGCHCGAVRLRVRVHERRHLRCNCSICAKKGFLGLIVAAADFELLQGEENLSTYRFNTGEAEHRFCRTCGIHPFSRPRSHPDGYDVNVRCLDRWSEEGADEWQVEPFDGQNWEASVGRICAHDLETARSPGAVPRPQATRSGRRKPIH